MKLERDTEVQDLTIWEQMILDKIHENERKTKLTYIFAMNLPELKVEEQTSEELVAEAMRQEIIKSLCVSNAHVVRLVYACMRGMGAVKEGKRDREGTLEQDG